MTDPFEDDVAHDLDDIADYYQRPLYKHDAWHCHQCREWVWTVDLVSLSAQIDHTDDQICAWRPNPPNAREAPRQPGEKPFYKDPLPREYLVKWIGRGFRHVTWVPHTWLLTSAPQKLKNFLEKGPMLDLVTDETLAARGDDMENPTIANVLGNEDSTETQGHPRHDTNKNEWDGHGPAPDIHAESSIPQEWRVSLVACRKLTADCRSSVGRLPFNAKTQEEGCKRSKTPSLRREARIAQSARWS